MSESKAIDLKQFEGHTPGPWRFDEDEAAIFDVNEKSIAAPRYSYQEEHYLANCRLIAAAPELLAQLAAKDALIAELVGALKDAIKLPRAWITSKGLTMQEWDAIWEKIDAALALAADATREGR